jgi:long-subunit fatty acid transport protein
LARATAGVNYRYSPSLTLTLQFDGHTAAYRDSALRLLGSAWMISIGGEYRFASQWVAHLALTEDVRVESAPDVSFIFRLARAW